MDNEIIYAVAFVAFAFIVRHLLRDQTKSNRQQYGSDVHSDTPGEAWHSDSDSWGGDGGGDGGGGD